MAAETPSKSLWRSDEIAARLRPYSQRLNPNSYYKGASLSRPAGMKRAHVTLVHLPPGKDSFAYHAHQLEEEWIYVLSGRGVAEIDGEESEVGAGDFMGFPTPSVAHLLKNPFDEDLVYLMGGEDLPLDIVDFPKLGKRYLLAPGDGGTDFFELKDPIRPFGRADRDG
jgi:uncharacterized cupin superfamily protein